MAGLGLRLLFVGRHNKGPLISATGVTSVERPRACSPSGLAARGMTKLRIAFRPAGRRSWGGETDRAGFSILDGLRGSLKSLALVELDGGDVPRLDVGALIVHGLPLAGVEVDEKG